VSDADKPDPDSATDKTRWPYWSAQTAEATGAWAQKRRLATAMRAVIERLVTTDAPEDELRTAADALERYATRLERHPRRTMPVGFAESANAGSVVGFFDYSPLIGRSNPLAPPLTMSVDGKMVRGTAVFGAAYEGPPGHVHGGFVAAAFDEVLGFAQSMGGNPGMTGTLTIRYRKPTPLHREIRMEGEIVRIEGRKIFTTGRMFAGDLLTAEAEGLFISVDLFKMRQLADAAKG